MANMRTTLGDSAFPVNRRIISMKQTRNYRLFERSVK